MAEPDPRASGWVPGLDFPPLADSLSQNTSKKGGESNKWGGYTTVICSQKVLPRCSAPRHSAFPLERARTADQAPLTGALWLGLSMSLSFLPSQGSTDTLIPYLLVL